MYVCFETYFPLVNVKITYSNKLPWITSGLRESVKKKSQLRSIMEKDPSPTNKTNYKKHRNLLTSMMRKRPKDYLEEQFEISNPIKKWKIFKDLINKTINNSNSTQKTITCGVPQGSILGPLFFLLCINDLPNVSEKLFAILFADDTSVFLEGKDLAEITNTLNAELAKLTVWLSANKLTLNTSKSHFMNFHHAKLKSSDTKIPVILSNTILVTFIKFLGVIIDNKLTFERHIVYTKNKISKDLGIITKARKYLNRETLLKLYNAFVFPYLTYCVEVWGTAPKKYLDPLIKIQKKIVRIITFSPYLCHTDPIFKDLNLLPISKLVTQRIGLLMFKYSIHSLPSVIEDLFTCNTSVSNHNTRNKSKLRQPRSNCEYMYRNISFTCVYIWNKIQDHVNVYSTYSTFKDVLKSFLLVHDLNYRIL